MELENIFFVLVFEFAFKKLVWLKLLAERVLEYCVTGLMSTLFYYFVFFYYLFSIDFYLSFSDGLKNEVADLLMFKDLYISAFWGGRKAFTTSSTMLYFYMISRILGFGAFISATLFGNSFLFEIVDNLIKLSALSCDAFSFSTFRASIFWNVFLLFCSTLFRSDYTFVKYLLTPLLSLLSFSLLEDLFIFFNLICEFFNY